jgi:large conductance mechanosensitive channel
MGMMKEFKEFAMRGNVMDMAVGVVIGAAFGKIVTSLVSDIFMPLVGMVAGKLDFSKYSYDLKNPLNNEVLASVKYGMFVNAVVDFVIVAFCLFLAISAINRLKRKEADTPPPPAPPTKDQELLAEIRDLLKARGA